MFFPSFDQPAILQDPCCQDAESVLSGIIE